MATAQPMGPVNPKTGMTHGEMREFVRNHFEEFVNRKNLDIGNVNFAPEFVTTAQTFPRERHRVPPARCSMSAAPTRNFQTCTWTFWT